MLVAFANTRPSGRVFGTGSDDARIADRGAEITLHEAPAVGLIVDVELEDRLVPLGAERDVVLQEDEMPHLVQIEQDEVGIVPRYGTALPDAGPVGYGRVVTRDIVPQQSVVEPAGKFVGVEKIDALHPLAVTVCA